MEKQKNRKEIQRFVCICSMCIMAFLFTLTNVQKAKAMSKGKSSNHCTLQSVTIEVNGNAYVCDGNLKYIPVEYDADWKELLKTVKITDYQVLVNDCCSHVKGHDLVEAGLYEEFDEGEYYYEKFLTYEEDKDGDKNSYTDVEDSLEQSYYYVKFCLDGNIETGIEARFSKEFPITYELNGGSFPEGMDVPRVCEAQETVSLVSPVKSGSRFDGWMVNKSDEYYSCNAEYYWDG